MFYLKVAIATLVTLALWVGLVLVGVLHGWWREPIATPGDARAFVDAAIEIIEERNGGNVALVLLEAGEVFDEYYATSGDHVDRDTLFPAASMSKWIAAFGVMKLAEDGRVDLDRPVGDYLTRWQLPPSEFDNDGVTVRRLLSHMAGLTDGLGYGDYEPHEEVPTLEASLSEPRASSREVVKIAVGREPGTQWEYSGGGYLILQLLVEEVTGQTFEDYMQLVILKPMGMDRSTHRYIGTMENASKSYDEIGEPATMYRHASSAATGFASTAADMALFLQAQLPGRVAANPLRAETIAAMRDPQASILGFEIWGLGTMLYAPTATGDFVFGHGGQNDPAINTEARVNPDTGDGIVVLVSGSQSLATILGFHWVFWQTGLPDFLGVEPEIRRAMTAILAGAAAILILPIAGALWFRRFL